MNDRLKNTIKRLEDEGFTHRVIDLGGPAVRTRDVAEHKNIDVDVDEIVKTIMFKSKKHGVFSVSVPGADRVSYKKIKDLVGDKNVSTLRPEEMQEMGWEPGECCPLTVPGPLYVDKAVMEKNRINTGSGDLHFGLEYPPEAILAFKPDTVVTDVREPAPQR